MSNPIAWILSGAGALLLGEVGVRLAIPEYRARPGLRLVLGIVLLMAGLGMGFGLTSFWPLILIAIGLGKNFCGSTVAQMPQSTSRKKGKPRANQMLARTERERSPPGRRSTARERVIMLLLIPAPPLEPTDATRARGAR